MLDGAAVAAVVVVVVAAAAVVVVVVELVVPLKGVVPAYAYALSVM